MIPIKTAKQIEIMKEGGRRLAKVFAQVLTKVKPGVKLSELDQFAEKLIKKQNGYPSFKMVPGYNWATCININQGVVHGIPGDYQLKKGDLVSLDMGLFFQGLHTDMARTFQVRNSEGEIRISGESRAADNSKFLAAGEKALKKAIDVAQPGKRIGHISQVIETEIKRAGFSPVRQLTGHGIGVKLHEEPQIFCYLAGKIKKTPLIKPGMGLAIEVIYTQASPKLVLSSDNWTTKTADGGLAGLFEDTVIITEKKPLVLTFLADKSAPRRNVIGLVK